MASEPVGDTFVSSPLGESQQRALLCGCLDLHHHMADMEAVLAQGPSPFSQYVNDLSPTDSRVVQDYFARLRATMLGCLRDFGIPLDVHRISLRCALQCGMNFLHIAVAENGAGAAAWLRRVDRGRARGRSRSNRNWPA